MDLSLFLTTLIGIIIFVPLGYFFYKNQRNDPFAYVVYGGSSWSLVTFIQFIIITLLDFLFGFPLSDGYSLSFIMESMTETRAIVFWYTIAMSFIGQIVLFLGMQFLMKEAKPEIMTYVFFGIGWALSEFVQRFAFTSLESSLWLFMLFFILIVSIAIGSTLINTPDNTKFLMFGIFMKMFAELALFGGLGFQNDGYIANMTFVLLLIIFMSTLAALSKKYPVKKKTKSEPTPA